MAGRRSPTDRHAWACERPRRPTNGLPHAGVISGIEWAANQAKKTKKPSVANLSLGGGFSKAMNDVRHRRTPAPTPAPGLRPDRRTLRFFQRTGCHLGRHSSFTVGLARRLPTRAPTARDRKTYGTKLKVAAHMETLVPNPKQTLNKPLTPQAKP